MFHWAHQHPMAALIMLAVVVLVLWAVSRPVQVPEGGWISGGMPGVGLVLAVVVGWILFHHTPAQAGAAPQPRVTHTTIVQQHITQHAGTNGWLVAFIAAVIVAVVIWIIRKLIGK
ncbi:MAG: hypothetical protein JWO67_4079 [Streptosporangiaceae bacterium]|nr:hypothetical protein [Streptosporangiaceae bacterium]